MATASKTIRKQSQKQKQPVWVWAVAAVVVVAVIGLIVLAQPAPTSGSGLPLEISVAEAAAKREAGAFILDVRQPEEWNEFHIPGATLIPLGELSARLSELPQDQAIVVVCRSGNRSQQGRDILLGAGFASVTSMAGGVTEWRAAGFETVTGP